MSHKPKVSVIIPNYNHARFLRKRVESVLRQTFQNFEAILLDDCSSDDSRSILADYASDPRVRLDFNKVNSGSPFKQWNKGVRLAAGEYVWIAESDDYADLRFLERLCAVLEQDNEAGFVYCRSWRIVEDDRIDGFAYPPCCDGQEFDRWTRDYCVDGAKLCNEFVGCNIAQNASAVLFRRDRFQQVGGADESLRLCGDWKLWAGIAMTGKIAYLAEPLNYYRFHSGNVRSATQRDGSEMQEIRAVRWWILDQVTRAGSHLQDAEVRHALTSRCLEHAYTYYPAHPEIYRVALQRVRELAGKTCTPQFGSWKGEMLKRVIGWKATRRAQLFYHHLRQSARTRLSGYTIAN